MFRLFDNGVGWRSQDFPHRRMRIVQPVSTYISGSARFICGGWGIGVKEELEESIDSSLELWVVVTCLTWCQEPN